MSEKTSETFEFQYAMKINTNQPYTKECYDGNGKNQKHAIFVKEVSSFGLTTTLTGVVYEIFW